VFQSFFLLPTLTARENVQVPMFEGPPLSARERVKKADELLELVGMAPAGRAPADSSSRSASGSGWRWPGRWPTTRCCCWPTSRPGNLDSDNAARVLDLLTALQRDRGLTLVVVTHSPEVAERADRVVRMRDGRVVAHEHAARIQPRAAVTDGADLPRRVASPTPADPEAG
jgi:putative ABC transport system ATP-binding protein